MTIYAIGDIQGCFDQLTALLAHIRFDSQQDTLWLTGDLVNRGPKSLEVLRFMKALGNRHKIVLGNHDLHLLAVAFGGERKMTDTFNAILTAPDCEALVHWLLHQPLIHCEMGYVLTHAGLAPNWSIDQAMRLGKEVEAVLQSDQAAWLLNNMYGNQPDRWDDELKGVERLRTIINYFTRMRLCHRDGRLDFAYKGTLNDKPANLLPWFDVPNRANSDSKIIFGHWAALSGKVDMPNIYALDTGCVWGNCLTAMRIGDDTRFSVPC